MCTRTQDEFSKPTAPANSLDVLCCEQVQEALRSQRDQLQLQLEIAAHKEGLLASRIALLEYKVRSPRLDCLSVLLLQTVREFPTKEFSGNDDAGR